jgi:hypothetical protein
MESAYLDLDLETDHGHPDHSGLMNLFRHWSWSGMVRATWAVVASTLGSRFREFCARRLGLELGRVAVEAVDLSGDAAVLVAVGQAHEAGRINFLEADLAGTFLVEHPDAADRLLVLRLTVPPPVDGDREKEAGLSFTFGIALASGKTLVYFRVQDHLRRIGLGRRALHELLRGGHLDRLGTTTAEDLPPWSREQEGEAEVEPFRKLFGSVLEEVETRGGEGRG